MSKCCGGAYSRHEWSRNTNLSGGERLENIARDGKMRGTGVPPGGLGSEQRSTAVPVGSFPFAVHTSPPSVYPWNAKANNVRRPRGRVGGPPRPRLGARERLERENCGSRHYHRSDDYETYERRSPRDYGCERDRERERDKVDTGDWDGYRSSKRAHRRTTTGVGARIGKARGRIMVPLQLRKRGGGRNGGYIKWSSSSGNAR
ncbi:hypothetical protein BD779DRAFT_1470274 [Infundibulicybe gibba]|nr:hypothetical protein BD779DRAFT_1470274 [Infundibulicybe gibba]